VVKRIFVIVVFTALLMSCNDNGSGSKSKEAVFVTQDPNDKRSDKLLYLDTAENIYNALCQGWVMEDDALSLSGMKEDSKFEIPYRSFYFAANGTFVKNPRNAMDFGTWVYDDDRKTITLNYSVEGGIDKYKIAALAPDELKLVNAGINTSTILKFISNASRIRNPEEDPFNLNNNRWRIKPLKKESDAAIHQRLKENIRFFILFYRAVIIKDDKEVSFWGLPSCFKWYGGGIYLKKEDELNDNWIRCFYNREQAMKAYKLADKILEQKYEWPKNENNWLKLNLAVLEQMYEKMDEIK
jgi:hypothetical protein